ncbi:hypothetical protein ES288_A13G004200v1 [Gossypium darwinii]|uniref:Uncharacterized protein n=1 Tax=Gossypium darwinii TaxID=34276 RepID=A0A5D2DV32_GOSDA|nr:hypothetical protein ES288_A13G004200v1 [Gossypium darwinii]
MIDYVSSPLPLATSYLLNLQFYEDYGYYETSDDEDEPYHSRGFKSLNTTEWETAIEGGT